MLPMLHARRLWLIPCGELPSAHKPERKDREKQRGEELGQSSEILVVVDQRRAHRKKGSSYDCSKCGMVLFYAVWSMALDIHSKPSGCPTNRAAQK